MIFKNLIYGAFVVGSLLMLPACEKGIDDFGNLNNDPNQTTSPVPSALLAHTISLMGSNLVWDQGGLNTAAGLYAQYFAETQYTDVSRYSKPNFNWDAYYAGFTNAAGLPDGGALYDLQTIINYNSDETTAAAASIYGDNNNQIAVARIIKAHYYKMLTDAYGDLPYFNALQGNGILEYDTQQAIYADLLKELQEAVAQINLSASVALQGDLMYGGNMVQWQKYANSLRLMIGLQLSEVDPGTGNAAVNSALSHSAGVIESNDDNATVAYPGGSYPNPFYNYYNITQRRDYAISRTMTSRLLGTNDPRISAYSNTTVGVPSGLTREDAVAFTGANPGWGRVMSDEWGSSTAPVVVIGAANIWLARAEAAQRGWTSESVAAAYATGIELSMRQWNVFDQETYDSYMLQSDIALTAGTELEKIAIQEWTTWYPNGIEGWNIFRRTGYPNLTPAPGTNEIPVRIPYGPNEYTMNNTNVTSAAGRYNNDSQFAELWWDK